MSATTHHAARSDTDAIVSRGLDLLQRHLAAAFEDPDGVLGGFPVGATVVLLPPDDPEVFERNLRSAARMAREGKNVYLCHVDRDGRPVKPAPTE